MEPSLTPASCRNFTFPKQLHITDRNDTISNLPDAVLSYILSLLSTKDAIRTSVLSKRWKELWLSIPHFVFDEGCQGDRTVFTNLLSRVIHRDTDLVKLSISCHALHDASLLQAFLCNVRELNLNFSEFDGPFNLPSFACSPESLISFRMRLCHNVLNLPSSLCFPSLKTLHLECVKFPDNPSIQQLFSNCCVLEHLVLDKCKWTTDNVINAPTLRSLTIHEELVEFFTVNKHVITIIGSELQFLEYKGGLENEYSLSDLPSLAVADISVGDLPRLYDHDRIVALRAFLLLTKLKNVRCLTITPDTAEVISSYEHECLIPWPEFKNLTKLVISESPVDLTCDSLLSLLSRAHCLQSIVFSEGIFISEDEDWEWDPVPDCFSSHLKNIHVGGLCGYASELCILHFFLKHAIVLQRMVISFSADMSENLEIEQVMRENLLALPRGSMCRIEFS